jgi:hypothetical protein
VKHEASSISETVNLLFPNKKIASGANEREKNEPITPQQSHDPVGSCAETPDGSRYLLTSRVAYSRIGRMQQLRSMTLQIARHPAVLGVIVADLA